MLWFHNRLKDPVWAASVSLSRARSLYGWKLLPCEGSWRVVGRKGAALKGRDTIFLGFYFIALGEEARYWFSTPTEH